jgi:2-succinyl-5-enolpyruvyl-6-hydroxy-3-cyclohexene-1-carboxylate synthase
MTARDTYLLLRVFVDELARCGLRAACTSPGSRSTPLVLSLVREPRIRSFSHLDERGAAFFALGAAKASGVPVALACTSGTAAAEYAPAVIEAHEARVPLLVLTADRPPELREVGAGQTIDQLKLYGSSVKWFFEVGVHDATPERLRWMRTLACRAYWTAASGRPGPVHLNFPLRDPLVLDEPLGEDDSGRPGERPWVTRPPVAATASPAAVDGLAEAILERPRGAIVAGRWERADGTAAAAVELARAAGYPLLADPLSGARTGPAAVAHYDALLRDEAFAAAHAPELVLRVGDVPTSKPLRAWLARAPDALQVAVDPEGAWQDPDGVVSTVVPADPEPLLRAVAERLSGRRAGRSIGGVPLTWSARGTPSAGGAGRDEGWLGSWLAADRGAARAIAGALGGALSEPRVAAELGVRLPAAATLVVASSMPVRDVETFWPVRSDSPRLLSNRGANGIDGTVSTALGVAAASAGPTVLLVGDVALAHDLTALLAARRLDLRLTIVVLNNDGGGIFDFLPVAGERDAFEEHVATPPGLDVAAAAALHGCEHALVAGPEGLRAALDAALASQRTTLVEVRTDRGENVALHRGVWEAVAAALAR